MEFADAVDALDPNNLWFIVIGLAVLATSVLPRLLEGRPLSIPMGMLALGYLIAELPLGLTPISPLEEGLWTEHITELAVIISLMGAGLSIDRPPSLRGWRTTWRLLSVTMILTIAGVAILGWWLAAFVPATALLLGAVIAPTDPVLASAVRVGPPSVDEVDDPDELPEDEVRFALTSEAGLNDGLAFPFTNLAIAVALAGVSEPGWFTAWFLHDVLYKLIVGGIAGLVIGRLLAEVILRLPAADDLAKAMIGLGALAATLIIYGTTEFIGGYGFLAVFVGALAIRNCHRQNEYHETLHILTEKLERILIAVILLGLGAAVAGGLLAPVDPWLFLCAVLIVLVVRPLAGMIGLAGAPGTIWQERLVLSFFGIRGVGSIYYLAYALNMAVFEQAAELWALVALVIVISIFVHGMTAAPVTRRLERYLNERGLVVDEEGVKAQEEADATPPHADLGQTNPA